MKWLSAILLALCLALPGYAQVPMTGAGQGTPGGGGGGGYAGPGDQVASATAWYGLRGYSAAYATGSNDALTVRCSSGSNATNTYAIVILTTGALDIATASTDCGTDGIVTATIATTVLSISAKTSGQVTIGDQITGTGIANPTYVISAGTCVSGAVTPPCTFNLSQSNTVGTGETITAAAGMYVTQLNDQTGNGNTVTATSGNQLNLLTNCLGSLPCLGDVATGNGNAGYANAFAGGLTHPWTLVGVGERITAGGYPILIGSTGDANSLQWHANANTLFFITSIGGQLVTGTANDGAAHVVQGINPTSGIPVLNIDNTATNGTTQGNSDIAGPICFPLNCNNTDITGYIFEGGIWPIAFNSTQQTNICHNAYAYWGTSTSC